MPRFFNLSKFPPNKTHVIELYSYSDEYMDQTKDEIISVTDAGTILTSIYKQDVRFVYAPDDEKFQLVLQEAEARNYRQKIINLL